MLFIELFARSSFTDRYSLEKEVFLSQSRHFHPYGDVTIASEGLQILTHVLIVIEQ